MHKSVVADFRKKQKFYLTFKEIKSINAFCTFRVHMSTYSDQIGSYFYVHVRDGKFIR